MPPGLGRAAQSSLGELLLNFGRDVIKGREIVHYKVAWFQRFACHATARSLNGQKPGEC